MERQVKKRQSEDGVLFCKGKLVKPFLGLGWTLVMSFVMMQDDVICCFVTHKKRRQRKNSCIIHLEGVGGGLGVYLKLEKYIKAA